MSLQTAFEQSASKQEEVKQYDLYGVKVNVTPSEKKFAEDLFDSLAAIPTGRKAIEDMKKYKVDFFLETALGTAGGYFDPENNQIVMAKSLGMDFMEFALVHEARHLLQNNQGRNEAEEQNLDYASRLMINRATEADAQTQAIQACKEWEAQGHDAPMKRFEKHYKPIVDRFNRSQSLSDAFKGWYDDERISASYEQGYDVKPAVKTLFRKPDARPYVSLKPADIGKFCGADRVDGFEEFLESKQARQVHLLTKTVMEMYDAAATAKGAPHDPSLNSVPVRDLNGNTAAQMYADKYIKETRKQVQFCMPLDPRKSAVSKSVLRAVDAVEKINQAAINGKKDVESEKAIQTEKKAVHAQMQNLNPAAVKIAGQRGR